MSSGSNSVALPTLRNSIAPSKKVVEHIFGVVCTEKVTTSSGCEIEVSNRRDHLVPSENSGGVDSDISSRKQYGESARPAPTAQR